MTNLHDDIKQNVMRDSALQEVNQTIQTFQSLETALDHLLDVEVAQLESQYKHLSELAAAITDSEFQEQLKLFTDNRLNARRLRIKSLLLMSRHANINAQVVLKTLQARQTILEEEA